jgi:hypothetical protein
MFLNEYNEIPYKVSFLLCQSRFSIAKWFLVCHWFDFFLFRLFGFFVEKSTMVGVSLMIKIGD